MSHLAKSWQTFPICYNNISSYLFFSLKIFPPKTIVCLCSGTFFYLSQLNPHSLCGNIRYSVASQHIVPSYLHRWLSLAKHLLWSMTVAEPVTPVFSDNNSVRVDTVTSTDLWFLHREETLHMMHLTKCSINTNDANVAVKETLVSKYRVTTNRWH